MTTELNSVLGALAIKTSGPDETGRCQWHWRGRYIGTYTDEEGWKALDEMIEGYLPR